MIYDLLELCTNVLDEEEEDFVRLCNEFSDTKRCFVGFMPMITNDLYPVYSLESTSANKFITKGKRHVYIVPIGVHDGWAKPYFQTLVQNWYFEDEVEEQYGVELEETILLESSDIDNYLLLKKDIRYNILYCNIFMPGGTTIHIFMIPMKPEDCWVQIMEKHNIQCDFLIDSGRGFGDFFDSVPLYEILRETEKVELLPYYYFKGNYIKYVPPKGFQLEYVIPEVICDKYGNRNIIDSFKEIYSINWDENKRS